MHSRSAQRAREALRGARRPAHLRNVFHSSPAQLAYSTRPVGGTSRKLAMLATGQNTQPAWNTGANELRSFCSACAGAFPCAPGHACYQWAMPRACPACGQRRAAAGQQRGSSRARESRPVQRNLTARAGVAACLAGQGAWRARTSSTPVHTKKRER